MDFDLLGFMFRLKTTEEIKIMQEGGKIATEALRQTLKHVRAGVSLSELDKIADELIVSKNASCSFKTVHGYSYATCINVNEGIVHGIPNEYKLKQGDLVSIDLGVLLKGYHTDLSYTVEVESDKEKKFLDTGKRALESAIHAAKVGNRIGDISSAMQNIVEREGYTVSELLVGHGIGKELHEPPYIPCYGNPATGHKIKHGAVMAVEVIYQKGQPDIVTEADNWTISTADKSLSALFEKTIAVTKDGVIEVTGF